MRKMTIIIIILLAISMGLLSGCQETQTSNNQPLDDNSNTEPSIETNYLSFGDLVHLTDGCDFTLKQVKTTVDYISVSDSGYIYVNTPDESNYGYLWVYVSAKNTGNEIITSPGYYWNMKLLVSGTEMEQDTPSYSMPELYSSKDLQPGAITEGWIVYAIPKNANKVEFVYELSNAIEIWSISNSLLTFEERNFNNLADGQSITFGSEQDYFELSISHDKTVESYSYKSSYSDYVYTEDAGAGYKFVFITVVAKNMGTNKINVPSPYNMNLITEGKQYSNEGYYGGNSYQDSSGVLYPGVTGEGSVVYEVPDSVTSATISVELASGQEAYWLITV